MKKILFLLSCQSTILLSNPYTYLDDLYDDGIYEPAGMFEKAFKWFFWIALIAYTIYSKRRDIIERRERKEREAKREKFYTMIENLRNENQELGEIFERSVAFISFAGNTLTWKSTATAEEKRILTSEWATIHRHIKSVFGDNVRLVNISGIPPIVNTIS